MVKRETLQKVGIDSSAVTFVAADFEKETGWPAFPRRDLPLVSERCSYGKA
jgi:hypothetical protein